MNKKLGVSAGRCPVTLIRHEAIPSHGMGPATMGRRHRTLHAEGLPKSASETTTHKIKQADEAHRMGTRTKSLRTMSTIMPNSFGRIRGTCCARNACRPTHALGAPWLRRRQTSWQYLTPPDFTIVQTKGVDINPDPCHRSSSQPALRRSAPRPVARSRSRSGLGCDPAPRWRRQSASGAPAGHLRGGRGDLGPWYL